MREDSVVELTDARGELGADLIKQTLQLPMWWLPCYSNTERQRILVDALQENLSGGSGKVLVALRGGEPIGYAAYRRMEWDTRHFETPIYRLDSFEVWGRGNKVREVENVLGGELLRTVRESGARMICAWTAMEKIAVIQGLEDIGFRTMDVLSTWIFDHRTQKLPPVGERCRLRGLESGDEDTFVPLAREAYRDTPDRFHADPRLERDKCDELYASWIRNSCSGGISDHVVVAELDGRPAGYTTVRLDAVVGEETRSRSGGMILSAVAPWAEGKGVYTSMIAGGLQWLAEKGVQVSHLGTQVNNIPVQRAWARLGFRLAKSGPSMHCWLD